MPNSSLRASPMRRLPRSSASIRPVGIRHSAWNEGELTKMNCWAARFHFIIEGDGVFSMTTLSPTLPARRPVNASVTVLAFTASIALLYFGRVFFITLFVASIIAFLLDPVVTVFVKLRLPRPVSSFVVCSIALLAVYLVGLGMYTEFAGFVEDLPMYSQRLNALVDSVAGRIDQI